MRELTIAADEKKYGVKLTGQADSDRLGKRLKGDFKKVAQAVGAMTGQQLEELVTAGQVTVEGHTLTVEDIKVTMEMERGKERFLVCNWTCHLSCDV